MARYKFTIGMRIGAVGGSESYISADTTPKNATALIQTLAAARMDMCHTSVEIDGYRIGVVSEEQKRRSVFYPPGSYYALDKPDASGVGGTLLLVRSSGTKSAASFLPDQARSNLLARVTFDVDRNTPHYLFGTPDDVLGKEPASYMPGNVPAYANALKAFRTRLIADGWSIRARRRDSGFVPIQILKWVEQEADPSLLGVVVASGTGAPYAIRDLIQILTTRRKGTDKVTYNGKYFVDSVVSGPGTNQFTVFLAGTETGDAASVKRPGFIQKIGYSYYPILDLEGIRAGTHKRGRPFGQGRGRRLNRVSLDP